MKWGNVGILNVGTSLLISVNCSHIPTFPYSHISIVRSIAGIGTDTYFRFGFGSGTSVIEPTGPWMGPNATADVMPPGGRQTRPVRAPRIIFGLQ